MSMPDVSVAHRQDYPECVGAECAAGMTAATEGGHDRLGLGVERRGDRPVAVQRDRVLPGSAGDEDRHSGTG